MDYKVRQGLQCDRVDYKVRQGLQSVPGLQSELVHMYGSETISSFGPKMQDILPTELKKIVSPTLFKKKIREWVRKNCPCRLCKTYVQNIGFL